MADSQLSTQNKISETNTFILPDLIKCCPFQFQINPHYEIAKVEAEQWLSSYDIKDIENVHKWQLPLLAAMAHRTIDAKRLCLLAKYYQWLFIYDDFFDVGEFNKNPEKAKHAADLTTSALDDPERYPKTLFAPAEMLRNIILEVKKVATEGCHKRLVRHIHEYINAILQQVIDRTNNIDININSYIEIRRKTGSVACTFTLIEYALSLDIPDEVINDTTIQELSLYCNDMITWANDLYSFNVEQSWGEINNLVVIAMLEGRSLQQSIDFVGNLVKERFDFYIAEKEKIPFWNPKINQDVTTYKISMEQWVAGYLHWNFATDRYFGTASAEVKKTGVVTLMPRVPKKCED